MANLKRPKARRAARQRPTFPFLKLSPELADCVFSFLTYEHDTLASLALTCRALSAAVRPFAFRVAVVRTPGAAERLRALPGAAQCVRELVVACEQLAALWCAPELVALLTRLERLEALAFVGGADFDTARAHAWLARLNAPSPEVTLPSVRTVVFSNCYLSAGFFRYVLASVPHARALASVAARCYDVQGQAGLPACARAPRLTSLSISQRYLPVDALLPPGALASLERLQLLELVVPDAGVAAQMVPLCSQLSERLRELRVRFAPTLAGYIAGLPLIQAWDAERMRGLRDVHLGPVAPLDTVVPQLLEHVAATPVEAVTLYAAPAHLSQLVPAHFAELNAAFSGTGAGAWRACKKVTCVYMGTQRAKRARERVREMLPAVEVERGIEVETVRWTPARMARMGML